MEHNIKKSGRIPHHLIESELILYRLVMAIFRGTNDFCDRFIDRRSRIYKQMTQKASKSKRCIVETYKLPSVTQEHKKELIIMTKEYLKTLHSDYNVYLHKLELPLWYDINNKKDDIIIIENNHNNTYKTFKSYIQESSAEIAANMMVWVINQTINLLDQQLREDKL